MTAAAKEIAALFQFVAPQHWRPVELERGPEYGFLLLDRETQTPQTVPKKRRP